MTLERQINDIRKRYSLSTVSFFNSDIDGLEWRVFASCRNPSGFQSSVESGGGRSIQEAIDTLDARLAAGPINKPRIPILDAEPKSE